MRRQMQLWLALLLALLALPLGAQDVEGSAAGPAPAPLIRVTLPVLASQESDVPTLAIYTTGHRFRPLDPGESLEDIEDPRVILAVWPDGRIVWSEDSLRGGAPYREATIDAASVEAALQYLQCKGIFSDASLNHPMWGPDASHTVMAVLDGERRLSMGSWHELYERGGRAVATQHGLGSQGDRTSAEVRATWSDEYRAYRETWDEVRAALMGLASLDGGRPATEVRFTFHHDMRRGSSQGD